jgi:hypothetical protein
MPLSHKKKKKNRLALEKKKLSKKSAERLGRVLESLEARTKKKEMGLFWNKPDLYSKERGGSKFSK